MSDDAAVYIARGKKDLSAALRWCMLSWSCILAGACFAVLGSTFSTSLFAIITPLGGSIAVAGLLFSAFAAFLALLGLLFPNRIPRLKFLILFVLSALPILAIVLGSVLCFRAGPH